MGNETESVEAAANSDEGYSNSQVTESARVKQLQQAHRASCKDHHPNAEPHREQSSPKAQPETVKHTSPTGDCHHPLFQPGWSPLGGPDFGGFGGMLGPTNPCLLPCCFHMHQHTNPFLPLYCPFPTLPPEHGGQVGGFIHVPLIPVYTAMSMPPSTITPMMVTMPMGSPMMVEGFMPPMVVRGANIPQESERPPPGEGREGVINGGLRQPHPPGPPWGGQVQRQVEPQRQVVRRFRVGFQLDLLLLLKLAVVVFVFNQDGSKDRLFLLLFLAAIVYMYQTGALTPLLRWFSQSAQRAMMPPQQPNPILPEGNLEGGARDARAPEPGEGAGNAVQGNEFNGLNRPPPDGNNWWGIFKEVQMLIVGFVTSLLPGFQHVE